MDDTNKITSMRILNLSIEDCLGCESVVLNFSQIDNVHLLLYNLDKENVNVPNSATITPVGQALQLLCTTEYKNVESLQRMPQLNVGKGCVKMTFRLERIGGLAQYDTDSESELDIEPSTSKQAAERRKWRQQKKRSHIRMVYLVNVIRRFDDLQLLEHVMVQVNSGNWGSLAIEEFHNIFFVQPQNNSEWMHYGAQDVANWLKFIHANADSYRNFRGDTNPFDAFAKLFDRQNGDTQDVLQQLTTRCLAAQESTRLNERHFVLSIFEMVRTIFEYITINEYTVWFFVPRLNRYTALDQVNVDDFDLCNVRTCIKLTSDVTEFFWHRADHNIMDILLVAFQMGLAQVARQTVLFLGQMEKLSNFICLQYVKASFMNSVQETNDNSTKWFCNRYLHRIIEISDMLGLIVFIEYPSGLTLLPEDRKIIKCIQKQDENTGNISWRAFEDYTKKTESGIERLQAAINI